jgi:transglutaminase-like putative cysteine protease
MNKFNRRLPKLLDYFLYFALVFPLSHMIGIGITLQSGFVQEILMLLSAGGVAVFVLYNPISLYFITTALVFAILIADRYFKDELFRIYSGVLGLTDNIINNFLGKENISREHLIPYFLLLCFVIALFTAIIIFKKKSIIMLLPPHLSAYLLYWYNFNDQAYKMLALFTAVYLILWSQRALRTTLSEEHKIPDSPPQLLIPWISTAAKYSLIIVILALLLPKTNRHITLPWLQDYVYKTFPAVEDMRSYDVSSRWIGPAKEFSFSTTGFQSGNSILGGPVIENSARVMSIKTSRSLYMRGNVQQTYTGSSWKSDAEHPVIYKLLEDMTSLESVEKELFYDSIEATVTYRDFSSTTVFSPLLTENINSQDTKNILLYRDGTLAAPEGLYDGERYHLSILIPKPYGIRLANGQSEVVDDIEDIELYLQLPEVISERTIALANEITKDKAGPYEKAAAIEDFLRKNYAYNLDVGFVLPGYDFVDYFLFVEKEGYCTYFASSMAIMLRIVGIPTRYVEGFAVRGPADEGIYEVTNRNAHSWVEAFIEPVGWMTFEPTPALPLPSRLEGYSYEESDSEDYIPTGGMGRDPDGHDDQETTPDDVYVDGNNSIDSPDALTLVLLLASFVLLAAIPGRIVYGLIKVGRRDRFIEALDPQERIIQYYEKIIQLLNILGYPIKSGETHYEYARRISYKFNDLQGTGIFDITDIFVRSKYGMLEPDSRDIRKTRVYMLALEDRAKKHLSPPKYYWLKYVKGI